MSLYVVYKTADELRDAVQTMMDEMIFLGSTDGAKVRRIVWTPDELTVHLTTDPEPHSPVDEVPDWGKVREW